jgi:hypothetical protein
MRPAPACCGAIEASVCVCVCVCVCVPQPLQDFVRSVCESEAFKAKWDVVVAESKVVGEA